MTSRLGFVILAAAFVSGCVGTDDCCTADTSPPNDGAQQPMARHE